MGDPAEDIESSHSEKKQEEPSKKKEEKPKRRRRSMTGVIQICNNEDRISNSSSPIENEKLMRREAQNQNKGKIELEFEMTEEQKKQE